MNPKLSILDALLKSVRPKRIAEVGMQDVRRTRYLLEYAQSHNVAVFSLDTQPSFEISDFQKQYAGIWNVQHILGLNGIPTLQPCDVVILDEDHNWYTTYHSLLSILNHWNTNNKHAFPIVVVYGTGWPSGKRDIYQDPERIPLAYRQALEEGDPSHSRVRALYEGTPHNGVRTAVDDFLGIAKQSVALCSHNIPGDGGMSILLTEDHYKSYPHMHTLLQEYSIGQNMEEHLIHIESAHRDALDRMKKMGEEELRRVQEEKERGEEELRRVQEEKERGEEELMRVQEEKEKITCALTASNQSRMQQGQLLAKELEKVQILFSEKHAMLEHVLHTRSWKITAPLRQLEKLIRYRCVYALFGSLKDVWEDFGKPFPKLTHTVRHRIFGKFPPKEH